MVRSQGRWVRALAFGATAVLVISACNQAATSTPTPQPPATTAPVTPAPATVAPGSTTPATVAPGSTTPTTVPASTTPTTIPASTTPTTVPASTTPTAVPGGQPGGTLYLLRATATDFDYYDPQRVYTGEDLAFFGATITRALIGYKLSEDPAEGTTIVPDMATDLGTANADLTSWSFTLKDGIKWQDGSAVTCEDVKYGVSRTFATDVINNGPTYAIVYLDIPKNDDGSSKYDGPYKKDGQDLFDKAVVCDGNTITFNLGQPVADFNYTTTLGFSAVPNPTDHPGVDTGESYVGDAVWSDGPYMIDTYEPGQGGKLIMIRNPNWDPASDDFRSAFPDKWEVDFGLDPKVLDQRMMQSTGNDATALGYAGIQPENLTTVFTDSHTTAAGFEGRAWSDYDVYSRYYWINTKKVTNPKIREAMAVALNRDAIRNNGGGAFVGDFADGVIKPNIGQDYAPTGFWTDLFGQAIPDTGDTAFAQQLITDSGEAAPTLTWDYAQSPTNDKGAAIIKDSLEAAGFTVKLNPIDPTHYYSTVLNPDLANEFGTAGWGPDWPNASTVIPPLFTPAGGFDLSQVDDAAWLAKVSDALSMGDRAAQATAWQNLNKEAMTNVWVIPTFFGLAQDIVGTNVGGAYRWSAYGSWPYAALYVKP